MILGFGPAAVRNRSDPFLDRNQSVRRDLLEGFVESARPVDVDVHRRVGPQAEMQTRVVAGKKAGLAQHGLRLGLAPIVDENSGSSGAAIGLYALQLHLDPVRLAAQVIAQQRRRLVEINDQYVDIPVVVEVPKSASSTTVGLRNARAGLLEEFFENALCPDSERRRAAFYWDIAAGFVPLAGKHGR